MSRQTLLHNTFALPVIALSLLAAMVGSVDEAVAATVAGRMPGTFSVGSTGAASYRIPIWTPPGVGDVQLDLSLIYSSRSGNGIAGVGWNVAGLSYITR